MPKDSVYYVLESGVRTRLKSVPAFLIDRVQSQVKMPEPPLVTLDDGRVVANPTDPDYIAAVQTAQVRQAGVSVLAGVVFGVELVDEDGNKAHAPSADEDNWEAKLSWLGIDWREQLSEDLPLPPDTDMDFARDACYLLYTQMSPADIQHIASVTMGSGELYGDAVNTFPGESPRDTNSRVRTKRSK